MRGGEWNLDARMLLLADRLTSQQHASVSQGLLDDQRPSNMIVYLRDRWMINVPATC